jgi:SecD/SecF fusion protein
MKKGNVILLVFILALFIFGLWTVFPIDSTRLDRKGLTLGLDLKGGSYLVYSANLSAKDPTLKDQDVMNSVINKIERRVNAFGVTEPVIQQQGENRVVVQLPGVKDIDAAKKLIGQTAQLIFKEQQYDASGKAIVDDKGYPVWITANGTGKDGKAEELTGKYLKPNSQVVFESQTSQPEVSFEWNEEGATLFEQITRRNLQKPIAIFLDNQIVSAPKVNDVIKDRGVITGVDLTEAKLLAIQLNSGSLDVPLKVIEEQNIDASLGADSLNKSLIAGIIGAILLLLFMVVIYLVPGAVAAVALIMYAVILLTIFKLVPITLTLPGIAAFIVSLGMAVDANVLIFERMKEEIRSGKTLAAAVEAGFSRAWPAIWDSNITTIIACLVLFWFGQTTGALTVSGFALTLLIGVVMSMFSAITITRTLLRFVVKMIPSVGAYGYGLRNNGSSQEAPKLINMIGKRGWFYIISAIIIIPGLISIGVFRFDVGVEFQSGTSMTYRFNPAVSQEQLRTTLSTLDYSEAIIQRTSEGDYIVRVRELSDEQKASLNTGLEKALSSKVTRVSDFSVSPLVAGETATNAIIAVLIAAVFMILYIAWAFRKMPNPFRWGVCAIIALLHDAIVVLGIFSILGWTMGLQIDSLFISAMLTIVGYSINNTVVVYDRIRENVTRGVSKDFATVVNTSVLEVMGRCLNTSLTTLFSIVAIFMFGGATIHFFMLALLVGVVAGAYDSICVAGALLVTWDKGDIKRLFNRSSEKKLAEVK